MKECQGPDCSDITDKIVELIKDQLDRDERMTIMEHIQSCPECAAEFDFLSECLGAYGEEECVEMTAAYWEEFAVNVHDRVAHERIRPWFPYGVVLPIAATLLAALGVGYFVFIRPRPHQVAKPQPVEPDNSYEEVYDLTPEEQQEFIQLINQRYGSQ